MQEAVVEQRTAAAFGCLVLRPRGRPGGPSKRETMKKGVPVSPGVAVAHAYCVDVVLARREPLKLDEAALSGEISRFDRACAAATEELDAIVARVSRQLGEEEAAIFRAHRLLMRDPAFLGKIKSIILHRHVDAPTALHDTLDPREIARW